jgi:hypothetical protein
MRGDILPLPQYAFMVWCLVKHRVKFTFTLYHYTLNGFLAATRQRTEKKNLYCSTVSCSGFSDFPQALALRMQRDALVSCRIVS